ncbi:DUF2207 domain-containing protein [Roseibium alexandrii]|uniref:Putative membrane protein (DUF2207) n=1 Tax=Roseibium alexandrii (strain DSM 17067 / NCIMB 14079 / DFL-11) TaxID=244592 RepID=A0A5E8GWG5_ROSAD|nr:DUF2207 domain-containing protein [Roseibium alexandrii]EEE44189.2 putative membrane protein (DUF2207) [Roseibium alexandrii DFL-11]
MRFHQGLMAVLAAVLWLVTVSGAVSEERILTYVSDIDVQEDGSLIVTETIRVRAEGDEIKRGIFRDVPLRAKDANGWEHDVPFELLEVLRDGQRENKFTRDNGRGVRIYIGREDVYLDPGVYTYTIKYRMWRQVRFFDGYDEVYWNATGNEWIFPIDEAVARVRLPAGADATQYAAYTGPFGSDATDYEASVDPATGQVVFETTQPLGAYEGLTVAVGFPKGFVAEPSESEKWDMWLQDQRVFAIGAPAVLILVLYYLISWWRVGRDPARGVIFPRFKGPDGVSPAMANYITNRGIEGQRWVALAAACLSLATKGRLKLSKDDKDLVLEIPEESTPTNDEPLPKGEAVIESYIRGRGTPLALNDKNGKAISALGDKFVSAINREYSGVYFKHNGYYLLPGLGVSVVTIFSLFYFGNLSDAQFEQSFLFGFFTIFGIAGSVGLTILVQSLFDKTTGRSSKALAFWLVFAVIFAGAVYLVMHLTAFILQIPPEIPLLPAFVIGIVLMFIVYANVIDIPTTHGRVVMDEIEGLKLYLSVAEKDRLNMTDAPDMSVLHFEKLLPYAVSLGVEKPWSTHFETWLSSAANAGQSREYRPRWYSGRDFDSRDISRSVGATASAMAGSFQSSLPVSSSSSSGSSGGGSSGGGGGGGGGGGW